MKRPIENQNRPRHVGRGWYERTFRMFVSISIIREICLNYKNISAEFWGSVKGKK